MEVKTMDHQEDLLSGAWEVVNEAIEKRKDKRFNWKALLKMSVTDYVKKYLFLSPNEIYNKILFDYPFLTDEAIRRLKINVNASYTYLKKR